jgi:hypothetical protein
MNHNFVSRFSWQLFGALLALSRSLRFALAKHHAKAKQLFLVRANTKKIND